VQRTELHFHLLPGVDDGPADLDEAIALARLAVADGTALVTVTPHLRDLLLRGILPELPARVRVVAEALRGAGVPLELRAGAELAHYDVARLDDTELEAVAQGPPGARWLLIEAPLSGSDLAGLQAATAEARARGFGTLIGHPERCAPLMEDPARWRRSSGPARGCRSTAPRCSAITGPTRWPGGWSWCARGRPT
jgi:protein-tyrosine phosphatase